MIDEINKGKTSDTDEIEKEEAGEIKDSYSAPADNFVEAVSEDEESSDDIVNEVKADEIEKEEAGEINDSCSAPADNFVESVSEDEESSDDIVNDEKADEIEREAADENKDSCSAPADNLVEAVSEDEESSDDIVNEVKADGAEGAGDKEVENEEEIDHDKKELVIEELSSQESHFIRIAARAANFSEARVKTICESILLVSDQPLTVNAIRKTTGIDAPRIRQAMESIAGHFREGISGIVLHEVAGGWKLRTCPTSAEEIRRFLQVRPQRLTKAALETMAIIAYRQPVTRPEIEEIRGVDSGAIVKGLLDKGLITIIGKKEEPGRPLLYATTRAFLEFFNLKDLASLPTLREYSDLTEESVEVVEEKFPEDRKGGVSDLVEMALESRLKDARSEDETAINALDEAVKLAGKTSAEAAKAISGDDEQSDQNMEKVSEQ